MIPEHPSAINISTDRPKIKKVIRVDDKYVIVIHKNIVELLGINDTTILEAAYSRFSNCNESTEMHNC